MSDDRAVNKVFLGKTDGRRKAARPKLRWFDCIDNDLKSMGSKVWRNKSEDRCMGRHSVETLVKLYGSYFNGEEEEKEEEEKKKP